MSENPNMTTRTQRRAGGAKRTRQTRGGSREKAASTITMRRIDELRPYEGNARTHSRRQIRQIADSIDRFGFTNPVLIADDDTIIAGHGRVLAAKQLGMREVPT
ncbi:MAG: ParB/Srx family N-terminal domain-containing protein, partial [Parvibaculum sp.]